MSSRPEASSAGSSEAVRRLLADYAASHRPELREQLIVLHLDLVSRLARRYAGREPLLDDLIQVGFIGLMKAIDRFDPGRKVPFAAYAIPTIAGEMRRYLRDKEPLIHIPRQVQEQRQGLDRAIDDLTQRLHRPPSDQELATELGWDVERVVGTRASQLPPPVSLDQPIADSDEDAELLLGEAIGLDDDALERSADRLLLERAIGKLTSRQRAILYLLFYEDISQAAIGERLSISQMQVSRLCRAALDRLRDGLDDSEGPGSDDAKGISR